MHRIIDVIKLIGKRGLSYRNRNNEAAYTLNDTSLDHGNFLEIILLLSKYDEVIKCHLDKVIKRVLRVTTKVLFKEVGLLHFCQRPLLIILLKLSVKNQICNV